MNLINKLKIIPWNLMPSPPILNLKRKSHASIGLVQKLFTVSILDTYDFFEEFRYILGEKERVTIGQKIHTL